MKTSMWGPKNEDISVGGPKNEDIYVGVLRMKTSMWGS